MGVGGRWGGVGAKSRLDAYSNKYGNPNRAFSLTWSASMQIYWKKESVCLRKEFNSHKTGLEHQDGRRFIVLGHQYGRRDVM